MEEQKLNEIKNPATPVGETDKTAFPEAPDNINTTYLPTGADLETLTDEERDLYNDFNGMNETAISNMPPDIRAELSALKDKLAGKAAPDPETAAKPEDVQPDNDGKKDEAAAAAEEDNKEDKTPAATAAEPEKVDYNEIIRRMEEELRVTNARHEEELRVANARYETLQGKYNAEVKGAKKNNTPDDAAAGAAADKTPAAESKNTVAFTDDELAALADKHGLDSDVISGLADIASALLAKRGTSGTANPALEAQVAELQAARDNSLFDAAIRNACGENIGLDEINRHPLFRYSARGLKNENTGATAWDDLVAARNDHNYSLAAAIAKKVVADMQNDGSWNYNGRYSAIAEPATTQTVSASAAQPVQGSPAAAVKPSAVTPHSASGVRASALHTGRTAAQAEQEYDALHKRFLKGDSTVLPRMEQLDDEITRLQIKERLQKKE